MGFTNGGGARLARLRYHAALVVIIFSLIVYPTASFATQSVHRPVRLAIYPASRSITLSEYHISCTDCIIGLFLCEKSLHTDFV